MLFSSIPFLYYFLPLVLIVYLIAPKVLKNSVLLLSSLFFYWWGEPKYVYLMLGVIADAYIFGILVEKVAKKKLKGFLLFCSVALNIGLLMFFKYADFFIENFNAVTGMGVKLLKIALPIGISFYIFQAMSYVIDVYRGDVPAQKNPIHLAAYVTMFPQLIAGPIVRYSDIAAQLVKREHTFDKVALGVRRFIIGLSKKILLANSLGELCSIFQQSADKSVLFYWMYAFGFMLQIYFDFSGYSDMAIGLGKIFGFDFLENFNYPFISKSITEFWRRWHMSLGSWFRDYVYIPLGGNRVKTVRYLFNIFVVWMLTGFWHGASWNFVVWGLYFAFLLIIEKVWLLKYLKKNKWFNHLYVMPFIVVSFVIFNASSMTEAWEYIGSMFFLNGHPVVSAEAVYYLKSFALTLIFAAVGSTPLVKWTVSKLAMKKTGETTALRPVFVVLEPIVLCTLLILCTAYLVDGSFNPFLYFRF